MNSLRSYFFLTVTVYGRGASPSCGEVDVRQEEIFDPLDLTKRRIVK
jgi:hypothetical protein